MAITHQACTHLCLTMMLVLGVAATAAAAQESGYALVGNEANPTTELNKLALRDIFTGKRKFWESAGIVQLVLCKEDLRGVTWVAEKVLNVPAKTLLAKIRQEVFKEQMAKPILVENEARVLEKIQEIKGGVGIVSNQVAATLPKGVVVLNITEP